MGTFVSIQPVPISEQDQVLGMHGNEDGGALVKIVLECMYQDKPKGVSPLISQ